MASETCNAGAPRSAAQYVRMSTENQRYSIDNQMAAIRRYASEHGLEVVQTYADPGRSGVTFAQRPGLRQLLKDVLAGQDRYDTLLVYDVSRWGRFPDSDESAHYEFLVRRAGVKVIYCAEPFENDGSSYAAIVKNLKRAMAGDYSRDLSLKVRNAQRQGVERGHWQGPMINIGLRRVAVDPDGRRPDRELQPRERKSFLGDHIVLRPGPRSEVEIVRQAFDLFVKQRRPLTKIATWLDEKGVPHPYGRRWNESIVQRLLSNEAYIGNLVSGKWAGELGCSPRPQPRDLWRRRDGAYEPIVDRAVFDKAQAILARKNKKLSDDELLDELRELWRREGRITLRMLVDDPLVAAPSVIQRRFGGLLRAFDLIGYSDGRDYSHIDRRIPARRTQLISDITNGYRDYGVEAENAPFRRVRLVASGLVIGTAVLNQSKHKGYWMLDVRSTDTVSVFVAQRLAPGGSRPMDFMIVPAPERRERRHYFKLGLRAPYDRYRHDSLDPLFALHSAADVEAYRAYGERRSRPAGDSGSITN